MKNRSLAINYRELLIRLVPPSNNTFSFTLQGESRAHCTRLRSELWVSDILYFVLMRKFIITCGFAITQQGSTQWVDLNPFPLRFNTNKLHNCNNSHTFVLLKKMSRCVVRSQLAISKLSLLVATSSNFKNNIQLQLFISQVDCQFYYWVFILLPILLSSPLSFSKATLIGNVTCLWSRVCIFSSWLPLL